MPGAILVAFASKHGSTEEVARELARRLARLGWAAEALPAHDVADVEAYDAVVLGSAIYLGHLHKDATSFLRRNRAGLRTLPVAVFAMGPRTAEPSDLDASRSQLRSALEGEPGLEPVTTVVFGGAFDPAQHRFPFNRLAASDVRDWDAIREWGDELPTVLGLQAPVPA